MKFLPRILSNDPCCQVWSNDLARGENRMLETADLLLMGPNRAPQGDARILHGNGTLWRLPADAPTVAAIPLQGVPLDNDHPHIAHLPCPLTLRPKMNGNTMTHTLDTLAQELQELRLASFDYDFAWRLGALMQAEAAARNLPAAITVAHGTDVVFSCLMPGATPDNTDWAARKRAVAHRFHQPSLAMRLEAERGGYDFNQRFRLPEAQFVASGGGFPLILRGGTLIGTAAVSGLPDVEDHQLVTQALRSLLG